MSVNQQLSQQKQMTGFVNFCKNLDKDVTLSALQLKLSQIIKLNEEFEVNQVNMEEICANDKEMDVQISLRSQFSDQYYFCYVTLQERIIEVEDAKALVNQNQGNAAAGANAKKEVKLPKIELTQFAGDYEDWSTFHDLFHSLIHTNKSIDDVQKLQYLKSNLQGDAEKLLRPYTITNANYAEAWKKLKGRYNHKRFIVDGLLKKFFNQPMVRNENAAEIKQLIDKSSEIVQSLQLQGVPVAQWDVILVHVIVSKLDVETHKQWELLQKKDELSSFAALEEFLESRWQSLEMVQNESGSGQFKQNASQKFSRNSSSSSEHFRQQSEPNCHCCKERNHKLYGCLKYNQLSVTDRKNILKVNKLCFNCLSNGHSIVDCSNMSRCKNCNGKHHTSIHQDSSNSSTSNFSNHASTSGERKQTALGTSNSSNKQVLLATAVVYVILKNGEKIPAKALVDMCSQNTIITMALANKLGLMSHTDHTAITGLGEVEVPSQNEAVTLKFSSHVDTSFSMEIEASIMEKIAGSLPSIPIHRPNWPHLKGLKFADPHFDRPSQVEILLGAEAYEQIILDGLIPKKHCSPTAQNSRLGWLLFGVVDPKIQENSTIPTKTTFLTSKSNSLEKMLKSFWEMEEIPETRKLTVKEQLAEDIFAQSVHKNQEGRYVVVLPFDPEQGSKELGNSKTAALSSLFRMETRFKKNAVLRSRYHKYIQALIDSHHIELVPKEKMSIADNDKFYLPHHSVEKEESLTTKLRVVFDASRKSSTGVSLNDKLLVGPKTQQDLFSILCRWRKHKFVFVADVEKMYRQVKIAEKHRDFQRLLWRFDENAPILEYRITTVIDGTASASFLATRVLKQLAVDQSSKFPEASKIISEDFYVDDMTSGSDSIEKAKQLQNDIINVMNEGKFVLRKWLSNNKEIMENVPPENRHDPVNLVELVGKSVKTLGVYWNQLEDSFEFKITPCSKKHRLTKRELLSDISKLFDPIGWLAPSTIKAKIFMQSLWKIKNLDWNDQVPEDKMVLWRKYREELHILENIKIPRWIGSTEVMEVQLHGFGDASNDAYSAVVYSRVIESDGTIRVYNMSAKTKVSPIKTISIPKLELCGSVLVARLIDKIRESLKVPSVKSFTYSDNTTVLGWINSEPNAYNVFVANRITEIQTLTKVSNWSFVSTDENPADCASRGIHPSELVGHNLWWHGPEWLSKPQSEWPSYESSYETDLEKKKQQTYTFVCRNEQQDEYLYEVVKKHSTLSRLLWNTAYITKFLSSNSGHRKKIDAPNAKNIRMALLQWTKHIQFSAFKEDIVRLRAGDELLMRSKLIKLRPFIDKNGLLRVGGRLRKSELVFSAKHPIILPKNNHFTKLVIHQAHKYTLHGGPTLMSMFLQNYWIFSRSGEIEKVISSCRNCFTYQSRPAGQVMADLPSSRVTEHRSFLHSGVDFAGPITTKTYTGRSRGIHSNPTQKSYISIFVCMATKAIHIELVSKLNAESFIACFKRFVSRRGKCTDIYSDCGKNFVGASRELRRDFFALMKDPKV